jgi:hypothetical protein
VDAKDFGGAVGIELLDKLIKSHVFTVLPHSQPSELELIGAESRKVYAKSRANRPSPPVLNTQSGGHLVE